MTERSMNGMTIEKAKAELQAAMSGPTGRQWSYGPAVSTVLAALAQAEQRIAELDSRVEPQEPIAWIVHARAGDHLTQDGDYVANAEGMGGIGSTPLYAAPPSATTSNSPYFAIDETDQSSGNSEQLNSPVNQDDTRRMDWLVSKTVNVREPLVYGSRDLFWSQSITDGYEDYHATKLREQIDEAMLAAAPGKEG